MDDTANASPIRRKRQIQAERRDDAERRIVGATIRLIGRQGFANLTFSDVGEEAGYSRGLAAHYFATKENLLLAVASHILTEYRASAGRGATAERFPMNPERLRTWARAVRRNRDISRSIVMIYGEALINEPLAEKLRPLVNRSIHDLADDLDAGIASSGVRGDINVKVEAAAIFALMRGALSLTELDEQFPLEKVIDVLQAMITERLMQGASRPAKASSK